MKDISHNTQAMMALTIVGSIIDDMKALLDKITGESLYDDLPSMQK